MANSHPRTTGLWRDIGIAFCWQLVPTILVLVFVWDSLDAFRFSLIVLVFLALPLVAGKVHKSNRIAIFVFLLPILACLVMFAGFCLIMLPLLFGPGGG